MDKNSDPIRPAARRHPGDARRRVLVVDDNADPARLMTLLLQHCGFDVHTLFDGHPVLATSRSFRPHFILLDIGLPGLDGYEVAEHLRSDADLDDMVIIAVSGYSPDMYPDQSRTARFDHYLTKPVGLETLLPLLVPR
jgi:CheY-like chemotaxis protein